MKNLTAITKKLFVPGLLNNTRANKVKLTYYSKNTGRYHTLSVCRSAKNGLKSAVEYLNANPKIEEICITGWLTQANPWGGKSEYHEFSTAINQNELNVLFTQNENTKG
jgi:hypothetical protein